MNNLYELLIKKFLPKTEKHENLAPNCNKIWLLFKQVFDIGNLMEVNEYGHLYYVQRAGSIVPLISKIIWEKGGEKILPLKNQYFDEIAILEPRHCNLTGDEYCFVMMILLYKKWTEEFEKQDEKHYNILFKKLFDLYERVRLDSGDNFTTVPIDLFVLMFDFLKKMAILLQISYTETFSKLHTIHKNPNTYMNMVFRNIGFFHISKTT